MSFDLLGLDPTDRISPNKIIEADSVRFYLLGPDPTDRISPNQLTTLYFSQAPVFATTDFARVYLLGPDPTGNQLKSGGKRFALVPLQFESSVNPGSGPYSFLANKCAEVYGLPGQAPTCDSICSDLSLSRYIYTYIYVYK